MAKLFTYSEEKNASEDPLIQFIMQSLEYFASISEKFYLHINSWFSAADKNFISLIEAIEAFQTEESNAEETILKNEMLTLLFKIPETGSFTKYYDDSFNNIPVKNNKNSNSMLEQCFICRPWVKHSQKEEFLTKILTFCLNSENCPVFQDEFFAILKECYQTTQSASAVFPTIKDFKIESEDQTGSERPDISIKENGHRVIAIENKFDAPFEVAQILRYCTLEDDNLPIVFSITYKSDCDNEKVKKILKDKHSIEIAIANHSKQKEKKQILNNIEKINLSQWGGHLYWRKHENIARQDPNILKVIKGSLEKYHDKNNHEYIYLQYFEKLIEAIDIKVVTLYNFEHKLKKQDERLLKVIKKIQNDDELGWEISDFSIGSDGPIMNISLDKGIIYPFKMRINGNISIQTQCLNALKNSDNSEPKDAIKKMLYDKSDKKDRIFNEDSGKPYTFSMCKLLNDKNYNAFKMVVDKLNSILGKI